MLQRIQSLYLFFYTLLAAFCFWGFPVIDYAFSIGFDLRFISLVLGGLTFLTIVLFSKRKMQLGLIKVVSIVHIAFAVICVYSIGFPNMLTENKLLLTVFFVLGALFLFLAHRGVKKDEALIRSLDRLR